MGNICTWIRKNLYLHFIISRVLFVVFKSFHQSAVIVFHLILFYLYLITLLSLRYLTLSPLIFSYLTLFHHTLSYLILPYLCCLTLSYLTLPYISISYLTLPYLTISYFDLCYVMLCYLFNSPPLLALRPDSSVSGHRHVGIPYHCWVPADAAGSPGKSHVG